MDRKRYWNEEYTKYWAKVTEDANKIGSDKTSIKKTTEGDYKSVGDQVADALFGELEYKKEDKLLDYGCGFGRFFNFFNSRVDYYGLDISESMIKKCQETFPKNKDRFVIAEGEKCPFETEYFDKIICFGVFDACYQERALQEMLRITKTGGHILFTGKNYWYMDDDEQAYIAEEAARRKGHPNYFTNVESMLNQLEDCITIEMQRYFVRRGDFGKDLYVTNKPERFYEYALIIKKEKNLENNLEHFADEESKTWMSKSHD